MRRSWRKQEEKLLKVANGISYIIMMDQTDVARHKDVMIKRLNEIVQIQNHIDSLKTLQYNKTKYID